MIKKILIANRGEIALRIIRACKEMDIKSVSVYSDIDRDAIHTRCADEAYNIGESNPQKSYLNMDKLISVAKQAGCEAIHPGYGFLAENFLFAERIEEEGLIFIGPNPTALKLVGDKIAARNTVRDTGAPIIPGMTGKADKLQEFNKETEKIGFPVIIKASMGGGGKGMRIVRNKKELSQAIELGRREAMSAFGDDTVYAEKYIEEPRHVEFQILADNFGNAIHLFERECSIQRRYQKIIEESPSTALDENLRKKMGEEAIKIVKACRYTNAGTVEFLLDKNMNFYFLEVNARIQVEHPVTELVTDIDLIKEQIKIASGSKLLLKQEELHQKGHAIEARIYAEDPDNNFIPSPGTINYLVEPSGPGIRLDSGIYEGFEIPVFYDPLISKLVVWGENRNVAISRLRRALNEYRIIGVKTILKLLSAIIEDKRFINGNINTHFLENFEIKEKDTNLEKIAAIAAISDKIKIKKHLVTEELSKKVNLWKIIGRESALR
ncbi:acetyl-CoA carboxylase biotin carboxylase subunit [candidate division WOR-3 bacterium]|nr:acetyl-CoA carboxylase biotin carboxylase subunit [candidate division WOR-3 bacterium]